MGENAAATQGYDEEDLADDVIFEPSDQYTDRKVAIAILDGVQVCWCCFKTTSSVNRIDAISGSALVRICLQEECRKIVGRKNRDRNQKLDSGDIIEVHQLPKKDRLELLAKSAEKKKDRKARG